jgi:hypothetical protein
MDVHGPTPPPALHRPPTPGDFATPPPVVAEEPAEQAEMLVTIKDADALAELAGVDPETLALVKDQEWSERK